MPIGAFGVKVMVNKNAKLDDLQMSQNNTKTVIQTSRRASQVVTFEAFIYLTASLSSKREELLLSIFVKSLISEFIITLALSVYLSLFCLFQVNLVEGINW
uniref:Uncharacterized protein n=1 Tax=Arundo donax TaxID=35708 RepID=A0A0A9DCF2_ARUDO